MEPKAGRNFTAVTISGYTSACCLVTQLDGIVYITPLKTERATVSGTIK